MDDKIIEILNDSTVGKIVILILGALLIWLLVGFVQKKIILKIHDNQNRYRAGKIGSFAGYILTFILILIVFSSKLSWNFNSFGSCGSWSCFSFAGSDCFFCRMACYYVW